MAIPTHYVHVYQRPKQGTAFLARHEAFNYQHTITNNGWFDTMGCDISIRSKAAINQIIDAYIGAFVAVYVDDPNAPIWEGLISRITYNAGNVSYTISLDEMANKVSIVYTGAANAGAETTPVSNTASQAVFGIKQTQLDFGPDTSAGTQKSNLQNMILGQKAWPLSSITQQQGDPSLIHLECVGIYQTIGWEQYFSVLTTTSTAANTVITTYLGLLANTTTFFDNADTSFISANTMTCPNQQRSKSIWDRILEVAAAGDGSSYWLVGITPTNPNTLKRSLYYRIANYSTEYTAFQSDGLIMRNAYGKPVSPWRVVPDRVIRVNDANIAFDGTYLTDVALTYIKSVSYDANSQKVQWFGDDDTRGRAAFKLAQVFKPTSSPFGAPRTALVT